MFPNVTRRHFIVRGSIVLAGAVVAGTVRPERLLAAQAAAGNAAVLPALRFGLVTDIHYADKATVGTRVYRDSLAKMQVAVAALNATAKQDAAGLSFAITLGDFIDYPANTEVLNDDAVAKEIELLKVIEGEWAKVNANRHYVLGNHCIYTLTKAEFFANTKARPAPYSFDTPFKPGGGAIHFVVLDACFKADGTPYGRRNADSTDTFIPESQLQWLAEDLAQTKNPVIVFTHQRLDGTKGDESLNVKNSAAVRAVLEKSGKVLAVLQGHSHQNFLATVGGIPYCVLRAMVEDPGAANNAFSSVEIFADHSIAIRGNFKQATYDPLAKKENAAAAPGITSGTPAASLSTATVH